MLQGRFVVSFSFFFYFHYCNPYSDDMHIVTLRVVAECNNPFGICGLRGFK
jgi:hypothetical protein